MIKKHNDYGAVLTLFTVILFVWTLFGYMLLFSDLPVTFKELNIFELADLVCEFLALAILIVYKTVISVKCNKGGSFLLIVTGCFFAWVWAAYYRDFCSSMETILISWEESLRLCDEILIGLGIFVSFECVCSQIMAFFHCLLKK